MKLTKQILHSLIKESIEDRIKMIDEAGEKAKVSRMQQEIGSIDQQIESIKQQTQQEIANVANSLEIQHLTSPEIISDKIDEILAKSQAEINALIQNKSQLEEYVSKKDEEFDKRKNVRKTNAKKTIKDGINKDKQQKKPVVKPATKTK